MITFTTPKALPNLTRWEVDDWEPHGKQGWGVATITLHSPVTTDYTITKQVMIRNANVANGLSDSFGYVATVGGPIAEQLVVTPAALALSGTGFDQAQTAWLAGGPGRVAMNNALAAWMLTAGVANSTMAGS